MQSGLKRRVEKLKSDGVFSILALDHGLSSGLIKGLEEILGWSKFADLAGIAAIVANIGTVRRLPHDRKHAVILQTMGSPSILGKTGSRRVLNSSVEEAVYFDADCISVQIDFTGTELEEAISEAASIRTKAHRLAMPVLFMITTPNDGFKNGAEILDAVKAADELGADLIKIVCETKSPTPEPIVRTLSDIAPVVMAGGAPGEAFFSSLANAKRLGFAGYCVGRNVFQNEDPSSILTKIKAAFQ